jgi:F-type H+-transporting ATPase subunit b
MDLHHLFTQIFQSIIHVAQAAAAAAPEAATHAAEVVAEGGTAEAAAEGGGVAGTLGINWKLFLAQFINFAVILGVLWKFVFNPVAKKLGERTDKIEKSLKDAQNIEVQKQQFEAWKNQEMAKVRQQASEVLTAAQNDAGKLKSQNLEQTRQEQQKLVEQAKQQIVSEKERAVNSAKTELAGLVTQAAEKILRKKIDEKTDKELIKQSLEQVR